MAEGFRPIVVKEAVGDRVPDAIAYNLFDTDSQFDDVEPLENVVNYLNEILNFEDTVPTTSLPAKQPVKG